MRKLKRAYLEITNRCNLRCSFCPGTVRPLHDLTEAEFRLLAGRLRPGADYLYFHVMGEPLLHPLLMTFLDIAGELGFKVILTTNGTLLDRWPGLAAHPALHKVSVSLQALEGNGVTDFSGYLATVCDAVEQLAAGGKISVLRLWNQGGDCSRNGEILSYLETRFDQTELDGRLWTAPRSLKLGDHLYLEPGEKFEWPGTGGPEQAGPAFCLGLRDQIAVLSNGTAVPCCLDREGAIPLGNLFEQELEAVLDSPAARALYDGFSGRKAVHDLCRSCGYRTRFN